MTTIAWYMCDIVCSVVSDSRFSVCPVSYCLILVVEFQFHFEYNFKLAYVLSVFWCSAMAPFDTILIRWVVCYYDVEPIQGITYFVWLKSVWQRLRPLIVHFRSQQNHAELPWKFKHLIFPIFRTRGNLQFSIFGFEQPSLRFNIFQWLLFFIHLWIRIPICSNQSAVDSQKNRKHDRDQPQ